LLSIVMHGSIDIRMDVGLRPKAAES
jgi:hypothetical protein